MDSERGREHWTHVGGRESFARAWNAESTAMPPLVFAHGMVVSGAYFAPTAELLADNFRVFAPDLPGFGRSEVGGVTPHVSELADALTGWIPAAGLDRTALVANSFGCQIAAEVALQRPDLVDRLVLSSPTLDPVARPFLKLLVRWIRESKTHSRAFRRLLIRDYARASIRRALATLRAVRQDRIEDKLPLVQVPTLVMRGTKDPIVSQGWAEEVTRLLPQSRLVVLPGAPHAMTFETPADCARIITSFLLEPSQGLPGS